MKNYEKRFLIKVFIFWICGLFVILYLAQLFLPVQKNFLGGGFENYVKDPFFWALGNYDGEHYVSIATKGYGYGERAFFPLYPLLINLVSRFGFVTLWGHFLVGISISLISFYLALVGFYKLLRIDFDDKFSMMAVIFVLIFPASFYFASVYTESLFFCLTVWSLYFARKGNFTLASLLGAALTATRFVGVIILPVLFAEWFLQHYKRGTKVKFPFVMSIVPSGLLLYMVYLKSTVNDYFAFFTSLATFGEQRSDHLILLPQVFYRYLFKILPNLQTTFLPVIYTTYMELFIGVFYLAILIISFRKIRFSYWVFLVLGYLIPTFSGSFSSLPRYVLVLFPGYIVFANLLSGKRYASFAFGVVSIILLIISFSLFSRGYWFS